MFSESLFLAELFLAADVHKAQMFLLAGFILLGWVLARRQVSMRKRVNGDARIANRELAKIRNRKEPAVPLCDAPAETQRWQTAIFDLQRELKAELDTRIVVVQTLLRQVDQRIDKLESLEGISNLRGSIVGDQLAVVADLSRSGHTATEIATKTGLPIGDVEMTISTMGGIG